MAVAGTDIFRPRVVAGLVAAGIFAFAAFLLLSAYADDFRSGSDGRGHALSVSGVGFAGIVRLVDLVGGESELVRDEASLETEDLLVVTLEQTSSPDALKKLLERRGSRATLLVMPKWVVQPDPQHPGWVRRLGPFSFSPALSALPGKVSLDRAGKRTSGRPFAIGQKWLNGLQVRVPAEAQTVSGGDVQPLLSLPGGKILLGRIGTRPLYILADPDLMNNQGLKDPATAMAALKILASLNATDAESVTFDLTLNGFGRKPSLLKLPFEPPFLALTLALFAAALLAGLHGAFRFGPERHEPRAIAFGKMALIENSAGLIQLAGRDHRTGGAYADLVRELAAHDTAAPPSLRGPELDAYLDRLSPDDGPKFSTLAERAHTARDRWELVSAARALFDWKKEYAE
jgi:hypothetical protein